MNSKRDIKEERARQFAIATARSNLRRQAEQWQHEANILLRKAEGLRQADTLLAEHEQAMKRSEKEG